MLNLIMLLELLVILGLVVANGLFAGAEIAILSASRAKIHDGVRRREPRALAVAALRGQPERFLATVQVGITVIGSAAAAFGGASIAVTVTPLLAHAGVPYAPEVAFVLVVAVVSYLSLVLGELVPKSLALRNADGYALAIARPLQRAAAVFRPLIWLLTGSSNLLLRLFGDRTSFTEARLSRDELRELVDEAGRVGALDQPSSAIAARALGFGDVTVAEVMVPRPRIVGLQRDATTEQIRRTLLEIGHSRMPVFEADGDRVCGYVVARDLLALAWDRELIVLADIVRPVLTLAETTRLADVLRRMQDQRVQLAVVVDEHGAVAGLVTLEDVLEELVGDIVDEHDAADPLIQVAPTGDAVVSGWAPIRKVNRLLGLDLPIGRDSTTVAGLCLALALMVPTVGTRLTAPDGTVLEVVDASARRVRTVRIPRSAQPRDQAEPTPPR